MYRLACLFLFTSLLGFSQNQAIDNYNYELKSTSVDSTFVASVINKTTSLRKEGSLKQALDLIIWLEEKVNKKDSLSLFGQILSEKSELYFRLGNYNNALQSSNKSLLQFKKIKDSSKVASLLNQIGNIFYRQNLLDSTLSYYNKSYKLKKIIQADSWQLAISSYNLALVFYKQAKFDETLLYYFNAIDWYKKSSSKVVFLPTVYSSISTIYKDRNDFVKAQEYMSLALEEGKSNHSKNEFRLMIIYNHAASLHIAMAEEEKAKPFLYKSLEIAKHNYGDTHFWTATIYGGLAKTLLNLKQQDSAKWAIQKAISIGENLENSFDFGDLYHIKSEIELKDNNFQKALDAVQKSRAYYLKVYGEHHWRIASTWLQEAKIYKKNNKLNEAKNALKQSYKKSNYKPTDLNTLTAPFVVMEALQLEFQLEEEQSKLKYIDAQIELINHIKKFYQTNEAKLFFNSTISTIIKEDVAYCYHQFLKQNNTSYLEKAFDLVQLHNNSVLAEELQNIQQVDGSKASIKADSLVKVLHQEWAQVKEDLFLNQNSKNPSQKSIDSLIFKRVTVSRTLDKAIVRLENFTKNTSKRFQVFSSKEIQKTLNKNTQVLQYFVGNEFVYVFSITSENISFIKLSETKKTTIAIKKLRKAITKRETLNGIDTLLYADLIKPILKGSKNKLIILPEGNLSYIPFEILKNNDGNLLASNKTISYQAAISLLQLKNTEKNTDNYWAGFSCNYDALNELPKGIEEVETIQQITSGTTFLNENVTPEILFKNASKTSILHLALHGKTNPYNALYSELLLNDESVTASQIYNENIPADLVVLSACETGYGTLQKGEGIMSLSRAFTYAGAKSTLTSLWKVPDKETSQIMVSFYEYLKEGENKDEALQNAKLDYLKSTTDEVLKHPYYWAGFVLSGDASPIKISTPSLQLICLVSGILVLVGFGFYYKQREQKKIL